ncbi:hypothetical protein HBA55_29750 [Pseudomaricurvus alkylphenolicus]|uniref:hypothetical protein n=1 Tax=Pseudomaricurvus alkylphenolicus TaxID=1306991 RepID=UPI00141E1E1A|nr:hypothetical protein [Pseudomaricurvus alkylphenolicus]NIB43824.1 hypothetical protein [Pseudomaricurvus alkylphenolicus]
MGRGLLLGTIGKAMEVAGSTYRDIAISEGRMAFQREMADQNRQNQIEDRNFAHDSRMEVAKLDQQNRKEFAGVQLENSKAVADHKHGLEVGRTQAERDANRGRFTTHTDDKGVTYQTDGHTNEQSVLRDPAKRRGQNAAMRWHNTADNPIFVTDPSDDSKQIEAMPQYNDDGRTRLINLSTGKVIEDRASRVTSEESRLIEQLKQNPNNSRFSDEELLQGLRAHMAQGR